MDLEPGRIGFMNTQRRENHSTPATKAYRRGSRNRWRRTSCTQSAGAPGHASPAPVARESRARARVGTAPPAAPACHPSDEVGALWASPGSPAWLATNSLQSDCRTMKLVQLVRFVQFVQFVPRSVVPSAVRDTRHKARSAPPSGAGLGAATGSLATVGSSRSFIPSPSGLVCLHPTLPRFPAGKRRWTERYDGKGNLHLLHAA
jgi:hypothetical protein